MITRDQDNALALVLSANRATSAITAKNILNPIAASLSILTMADSKTELLRTEVTPSKFLLNLSHSVEFQNNCMSLLTKKFGDNLR